MDEWIKSVDHYTLNKENLTENHAKINKIFNISAYEYSGAKIIKTRLEMTSK
jgi:translation initiation factor 2 alpha subunit (eIF-2alpha)